MTKDQIRTIFMQRGFTIKEGQDDLKDYVYEAANDLIRAVQEEIAASAPNPSDKQEAVAWYRQTDITELTDSEPETDGWTPLYAAPLAQSAEMVYLPVTPVAFDQSAEQDVPMDPRLNPHGIVASPASGASK